MPRSTFIQRQVVGRLVRQIEREYRNPALNSPVPLAEAAFKRSADAKGAKLYRAGWPDFLVEYEGEMYGVEVKNSRQDPLRPSQVRMFKALEKMGVQVYVWIPQTPKKLRPWRNWPGQDPSKP